MSPRTVERVEDWETVPFGGGYGGLRDLASQEFSGVVTAGPSRLFMIRGTVVGILDGSMDDFEDAGGTARKAGHPALPLLAVMQERSEEVRAQYYTEETPIADVNSTLEDGGFTGYVELAENVLSGDYYQVYHQGRSMSVAYVGSAERLITDDDAFEQANDEVGIYEVRPVEVEAIDIPEPDDDETGQESGRSSAATEPGSSTEPDEEQSERSGERADESTTSETGASAGSTDADEPESGVSPDETDAAGGATAASEPTEPVETDAAGTTNEETDTASRGPGAAERAADPAEADSSTDSGSGDQPRSSGTSRSEQQRDQSDRADSPSTDSPSTDSTSTDSTPTDSTSTDSTSTDSTSTDSTLTDSTPTDSRATDEGSGTRTDVVDSTDAPQSTDAENTEPSSAGTGQADSTGRQPQSQDTSEPRDGPVSAGSPSTDSSSSGTTATDSPPADSTSEGSASTGSGAAGSPSDLEMRSIPSLDPSRTEAASKTEKRRRRSQKSGAGTTTSRSSPSKQPQAGQDARSPAQESETANQQPGSQTPGQHPGKPSTGDSSPETSRQASQQGPSEDQSSEQETNETAPATTDQRQDGQQPSNDSGRSDQAAKLQTELAEREQELTDLRTDLERVEAERDELESKHGELETERDRLESELEEARAEVQRLEERLEDFAAEGALDAETQLSATEAIDNTNLFVRYRSKGDATLETAHASDADRATVAENLRLEYHTQFDAENAAVGNEPFEEFLTGTISYRFVEWLVENLLYEIRDTGHADSLTDLYNALPRIDRAELNGQVSVTYTENGEEHRAQERFDVVVRDRMGNPLVVANINDSRDPATDSMMTDLVKRAERVGESSETLAGAFLVTASFFEPEALETADGATSSGLFSRDKRKSFVNLSRKDGYHLCLVEARNQEFHLAVPEL